MGGKTVDTGETLGEGGDWYVFMVVAVDGRSFPRLEALDCKKALWIRGLELGGPTTVPKDVEFKPT
jgi:hypothetical protein